MRYILLSILCYLTCSLSHAQVSIETQLDSSYILIGEQVHLTATVSLDKKQKATFPEFENGYLIDGVEVLERSKIDTVFLNEGKRMQLTRSYTITAFDSALYYLPPFTVSIDGKEFSSSDNLGLKVSTIPIDTADVNNIFPPHIVVEGKFNWSPYLLSIAISIWIGLIIMVFLLCKLSNKKPITKKIIIPPPIPPHKKAMEAIKDFKENFRETLNEKTYYIYLTNILRTYIEERFHINAHEMTSSEIILMLQKQTDINLFEIKEVLTTADLVKFAKYQTSIIEKDKNLANVLDFVNITQQQEQVQAKPIVVEQHIGEEKEKKIRIVYILSSIILSFSIIGGMLYLIKETFKTFF